MITRNSKWWLPLILAAATSLSWRLQAQDQNTSSTPPAATEADSMRESDASEKTTGTTAAEDAEDNTTRDERPRKFHEVVFIMGRDVELKADETAGVVVAIGGNAKVRGKVEGAAVAVWGNLDVQGSVREAAVAVLGNLTVGHKARIHGSAIAVGGKLDVAEGGVVDDQTQEIDFPAGLKSWFQHCVILMRPLAPQVGWVWVIAGMMFLIYLAVAALFPRPVEACVGELAQRPATTLLMGFLTLLLLPLLSIVLTAVFGLGLIIMPFVVAALFLGGLVGKVALLQWLGIRVGTQFGAKFLQQPLIGLVIGTIIVCLLYMVPFLGLMTFCVLGLWATGVAVTAAFLGLRRELPERPKNPPPASGYVPLASTFGAPVAMAAPSAGLGSGFTGDATAAAPPAGAPLSAPPPVMPETLSYPRASFWQRMGAAFLDIILVSILGAIVDMPPWALLIALAYFAGMWAWKGTSIGGIVLGLKVVRQDGQPVTFAVALVRALAGAFSTVVFFLGFLWIAWDPEKQGWHDKIAGTVVLKLPKGTPLVCL